MKSAYQLAAEFRLRLLTRDTATREQLLLAYQQSFAAIEERLREIALRMTLADTTSLFAEQRRLKAIQREVTAAINELAEKAAVLTVSSQQAAVTAARVEAIRLIEAKAVKVGIAEIGASFNTFPAKVVGELVGTSHRHPIDAVFDDLAKDLGQITGQRIKHALVRGVALGESPDRVTRRIMREVSARQGNSKRDPVVVRRLRMVARNETFRAYRKATLATYQENDDVVKRWRWVSRQSATTCIVCFAMDGKTFPLSTPFASHPGCRCVMVSQLEGETDHYKTGPEKFDELEPGVQRSILGDRAFEAWESDEVGEIGQFVELVNSRKWGPSRVRRSLDELLGKRKTA